MNSVNEKQRTALHITSIEGYSAIIECLVGCGVAVNVRDSDGNTVLHIVFVNKNARPLSKHTPQMNLVIYEFGIHFIELYQNHWYNMYAHYLLCLALYSIICLQVCDELSRLSLRSMPVYLIVACFLVQEGGDLRVRNNRGQTAAEICPPDMRDVLLNYFNKSK